MKTLLHNLFQFEQPDSAGVKLYLRFFELFTVINSIIYAWSWGRYILRISDVVLPLGLAQYINIELFLGNSFALINAGLITAFVLTAFFFNRLKWLYAFAIMLLHIQYVTRFSLGEIPHSSNLLGFSLLGLAIGSVFFNQKQRSLQFAFGFTIFFIGLGYTTAGFSKLIGTGFTWVDGNHLWLWIAEKGTDVLSAEGRFETNIVQEIALSSRLSATAILSFGLLTELSGFLAWWKKFRPYIFLLIIGMHVGIYLSMNILFLYYSVELIIIGFPWYRLLNRTFERYNFDTRNSGLKWILY